MTPHSMLLDAIVSHFTFSIYSSVSVWCVCICALPRETRTRALWNEHSAHAARISKQRKVPPLSQRDRARHGAETERRRRWRERSNFVRAHFSLFNCNQTSKIGFRNGACDTILSPATKNDSSERARQEGGCGSSAQRRGPTQVPPHLQAHGISTVPKPREANEAVGLKSAAP